MLFLQPYSLARSTFFMLSNFALYPLFFALFLNKSAMPRNASSYNQGIDLFGSFI